MSDKRNREFLNQLLEAALPRHSRVEPRPGLEERVVARLREQPRSVIDFPFVRWSVVALSVVALAVGGFLSLQRSSKPSPRDLAVGPQPSVASLAGTAGAPSAHPSAEKAVPAPLVRRPRSSSPPPRRAALPVPRRQRFPTRTGISEQERLMLVYVAETPLGARQSRPSSPPPERTFRIEPILIEPVVFEEIRIASLEFQ
jgi:hypothetical protein